MFDLIISIIFIASVIGALIIVFKKIPVLSTLPKNGSTGLKRIKAIQSIENKIKDYLLFFTDGKLLHVFLSWLKCQILKIETWIDELLHGIRKKAKTQKRKK